MTASGQLSKKGGVGALINGARARMQSRRQSLSRARRVRARQFSWESNLICHLDLGEGYPKPTGRRCRLRHWHAVGGGRERQSRRVSDSSTDGRTHLVLKRTPVRVCSATLVLHRPFVSAVTQHWRAIPRISSPDPSSVQPTGAEV